ncbi:PRTRC system ThiF family protein [Microcoleus sp. BROC3]|uniref:PRTRC system ThiF family protein n=1 Tax=Microcoleus sp. BROC3 TaxID=3055323 RepID=UPI002FD2A16A
MLTKTPLNLDFEYANSTPLLLKDYSHLHLWLVGCGGTGSYVAESLARLAYVFKQVGKNVNITFVDPDIVEGKNLGRQRFCQSELGLNKATTLALRYNLTWGLEISAIPDYFDPKLVKSYWNDLVIIIGCVDNSAARRSLGKTLENNRHAEIPRIWYLDAGNNFDSGQILLGSHNSLEELTPHLDKFKKTGIMGALPSPVLQCPNLIELRPEELRNTHLSCAELANLNAQSLTINQTIASVVTDYLFRLSLTKDLRNFATFLNLKSGSMRSEFISCSSLIKFSLLDTNPG